MPDPFKRSLVDPFKGTLVDPLKGTLVDPFKRNPKSPKPRNSKPREFKEMNLRFAAFSEEPLPWLGLCDLGFRVYRDF